MRNTKLNPLIALACFGMTVAEQALAAGQIVERRWTDEDVISELGISRNTLWRWRRDGKLDFVRVGVKHFYWTRHLREAGLI